MTAVKQHVHHRKSTVDANLSATQQIDQWFAARDWRAFSFQRQCWSAYESGHDFLLHSSTGSGKTLAAWLGPIRQFIRNPGDERRWTKRRGQPASPPFTVLWITPLRALSNDTLQSLQQPISELGLPWTVESRTGDSSSAQKARLRRSLPTALVTTPESLTLMLSYPDSLVNFATLKCIVVDEWHELLGTKRGTQTELALARLRKLAPDVVTCGLSATLGNLDDALHCLVGAGESRHNRKPRLIRGTKQNRLVARTLLPQQIERFPWSGHMGLSMVESVATQIEAGGNSLVFTNTRNQAETWYRGLLACRPRWAGQLALHHGSLDSQARRWVEDGLRSSTLKAVVCTSSLDLGVDFPSISQVFQVGSPKGIARLLQRAGRSGHQPDGVNRSFLVPTNALEMIEFSAALHALRTSEPLEAISPLQAPLDCMIQHIMTLLLAGPMTRTELMEELRTTCAYQSMDDEQLDWALSYLVHGGEALQAYPDFHRVTLQDEEYCVTDSKIGRLHRLSIGTIVSEMAVELKFLNGSRLGSVDEGFVSRLEPGDTFQFAGKSLQLVQLREGIAVVRKSKKPATVAPRWNGGRLPMSPRLASAVRHQLHAASLGRLESAELRALDSLLDLQTQWSVIPTVDEMLIERYQSRGRYQWCVYPLEGHLVHEGLSALIAHRISLTLPMTVMMTLNEYGFMLESTQPLPASESDWRQWLRPAESESDLLEALNSTEMAKRQFREIARIAGLIHPGYPGQPKRARHLQASSNMFFDTFQTYDRQNLLVHQAMQEVLQRQLDWSRLIDCLASIQDKRLTMVTPPAWSPLAFPLFVDRLRDRVSSETLDARIAKELERLNRLAGAQ